MVRKAIEEHEGGAHMKIEAAVTHGQGEEFKIGEVELAEPRSNEVLVRVVASPYAFSPRMPSART